MRKHNAKATEKNLPKSLTTLAIDLAKNVFQVAGENKRQSIIFEHRIRGREAFMRFLEQLPPRLTVLMETGASAQYYARSLEERGISVRILPAQHITRHRHGGKNDRNDTHAILRAGRDQSIHAVPIKTTEQQLLQTIHRIRQRNIRDRTALSNQLRGILLEHNIAIAQGHKALERTLSHLIDHDTLPTLTELLAALYCQWQNLGQRIDALGEQLKQSAHNHPTNKRLMALMGVGPITATALQAKHIDPKRFKNARQFAAYFGITPASRDSGDKYRQGGMSKRGDSYIRSLLIEGAHAAINHLKSDAPELDKKRLQRWVNRHGRKGAAIRLANHNLRIIWRLLQDENAQYNPNHRGKDKTGIAEQGGSQAA